MPALDRQPAILVLADGTVFRGISIGAQAHTAGEVVFNTAMTGLPGNPDRSVLLPADRHADLSAHRQRRRQSGRCRIGESFRRRTGHPRPAAARQQLPHDPGLARLPERPEHPGHCQHRHAQAHPHPARQGRAKRLPDGRQGRRGIRPAAGARVSPAWPAWISRKSSAATSLINGTSPNGRWARVSDAAGRRSITSWPMTTA